MNASVYNPPVPVKATNEELRAYIAEHSTSFYVLDDTDADFITTRFPSIAPVAPVAEYENLYNSKYRVMTDEGTHLDVTIEIDPIRNAYLVFEYNPSALRRKQLGVLYQRPSYSVGVTPQHRTRNPK